MNKTALFDDLTEAFILYQHRLETPFPSSTESPATLLVRYRNDPLFHARVRSLVSGVMAIVDKHVSGKATGGTGA